MEQQIRQIIRTILLQELGPITNDPKFSAFNNKNVIGINKYFGTYKMGYSQERQKEIKLYEILKSIKNKFGFKIKKFLGKGAYGYAFLTDDNKVLKITKDHTEALAMIRFKNLNSVHFPKVYSINKIKIGLDKEYFIILKEFIFHNQKYANNIKQITQLLQDYVIKFADLSPDNKFPSSYYALIRELIDENLNKESFIIKSFIEFLKNEEGIPAKHVLWIFNETISLCSDLIAAGFKTEDIHAGNIGIKNKHLVYFDANSEDSDWPEELNKYNSMDYDITLNELGD